MNSALRYRAQAPLVDSLLAELGLKTDSINGLTASAGTDIKIPRPTIGGGFPGLLP